jgi:hypothetical protein
MKQFGLLLALLVGGSTVLHAQQGGSIFLSDIEQLLLQKKELVDRIRIDFELFRAGSAVRISRAENPGLAGVRIGPYHLLARPKGSTGPYAYEIRIETKVTFLNSGGRPVSRAKATEVREEVQDVAIRPLPEGEWLTPSAD